MNMKNWVIVLLLALLSIPYCSAALNNEDDKDVIYISYYLNNGETYYIYSDIANVRNSADIDSEIISKLQCGDEVTFIDYVSNSEYTHNRLIGRWLKIKYTKDNTEQEGYIWEGNISPQQLRRNDLKFIFGMEQFSGDRDSITWQLKTSQNNQIISKINFKNTYIVFYTANIIDDAGLENAEKIIKLGFSGESCGVPTIDYFFAWNNNSLYYIDNTYSVGDADAYSYTESIAFPNGYDCGICTTVIKLISQYINPEYEEDNSKKSGEPETKYKTEVYVWDGKKLILQKSDWKNLDNAFK